MKYCICVHIELRSLKNEKYSIFGEWRQQQQQKKYGYHSFIGMEIMDFYLFFLHNKICERLT
jgi:hypothetical protein